ncbi:MAG: VWA domain-containing protein [Promethearchaeota archaeon]
MSSRIPENIAILIDTSRSMRRTDYEPTRLESVKRALKYLIKERLEVDNSSSFAIIQFSDKAEKIIEFSNIFSTLEESLDSLEYKGTTFMGGALALAIKMEITELRKVGAKNPKILIVSDGNNLEDEKNSVKMAKIAAGLGIEIDVFRLGEISNINVLKRLTDITRGTYFYNNNSDTLMESARKFAYSNVKSFGKKVQTPLENPVFARKIAAPLLTLQDLTKDQEERLKQIRGEVDYKKCSICFMEQDPINGASFFLTGRYCPNCQAPFHIHCLSEWADSQKDNVFNKASVVRCPHCFYLLKIPSEVSQVKRLKILSPSKTSLNSEITPQEFDATKHKVSELGEGALYKSCPVCNFIFEPEQHVIMCNNPECKTLYHEECFKKLEGSICKICSAKLNLR